MKEIFLYSCYIIGVAEIALGVYFAVTNSKSESRRLVSLLAFATGAWVVLSAHTSYREYSLVGYFEAATLFFCAIILITAVLHFALVYPYKLFNFDKLHAILIYTPGVLLAWELFFSRTIITSYVGSATDPGTVLEGPLYGQYGAWLAVVFILALTILIFRLRTASGYFKWSITLAFWSFVLGGSPGVVYYLVLPIFYPNMVLNPFVGVLPTAIWVGVTAWIVTKKRNSEK